ncbi:Required for respiratory growth protein 9 mitochondrial [Coniothyrium glycines]
MKCQNCARQTLSLFIRSITNSGPAFATSRSSLRPLYSPRFVSTVHQLRSERPAQRGTPKAQQPTLPENIEDIEDSFHVEQTPTDTRPAWAIQKAAIKEKLAGEAWNPRKKLSPDTMEGIRHLHETQPERFTTPILAQHFKVSPEAIRRILKSRWRPSDAEHEARMLRWDKRGERIWSNLVEMGVKPPKRWRDMGVGKAAQGERPRWKGRQRNMVDVRDSVERGFEGVGLEEDILPTVGGKDWEKKEQRSVPLSQRL